MRGSEFHFILRRKEHEALGIEAGLSKEQLASLKDVSDLPFPLSPPDSDSGTTPLFTPLEAAIISYTDSSTRHIKVPRTTFDALRQHLTASLSISSTVNAEEVEALVNRKIMEITATVAGYNTVSRILVALDVGGLGGYEGEI